MVDAPDSKSGDRKIVWVRVPPPVLLKFAYLTPALKCLKFRVMVVCGWSCPEFREEVMVESL